MITMFNKLIFVMSLLFMNSCLSWHRTMPAAARGRVLMSSIASLVAPQTQYRNTLANVAFTVSKDYSYKGDMLILPFYKAINSTDSTGEQKVLKPTAAFTCTIEHHFPILDTLLAQEESFKADVGSKAVFRIVSSLGEEKMFVKYVAFVGLGEKPKETSKPIAKSTAKSFISSILSAATEANAVDIGIILPSNFDSSAISQLVQSTQEAKYTDNRYRKEPKEKEKSFSVRLLGCSAATTAEVVQSGLLADIETAINNDVIIASGVRFARDLVNAPSNSKTPTVLAEQVCLLATELGIDIKILGEKECLELGMGCYLGVQQGSMFPPQFIHATYRPPNNEDSSSSSSSSIKHKVALIGKGLTFDSGGYNLKAGKGSMIEQMKDDMGGCAAVFGAMKAIGQLKPNNMEVHFISAVCENMISAQAIRPGDILVAMNGKTVEVLDTDAEGRLTLADALVYADRLGVDTVIDLATLTGSIIAALGDKVAGLYTNNANLQTAIEQAAKRSNEKLWSMPMEDSYKDTLKSKIADWKNISSSRWGDSIMAALFLQEFIENATTNWAHIDMAGPVTSNGQATGYGVKLLVEYIMNLSNKSNGADR